MPDFRSSSIGFSQSSWVRSCVELPSMRVGKCLSALLRFYGLSQARKSTDLPSLRSPSFCTGSLSFMQAMLTFCLSGTGTERIEEELGLLFPERTVLRIDRDSAAKKHAQKKPFKKYTVEKWTFWWNADGCERARLPKSWSCCRA